MSRSRGSSPASSTRTWRLAPCGVPRDSIPAASATACAVPASAKLMTTTARARIG